MGSTLKGKSAIVTGATSGIGNAIASAFAEEGCNLMFNGFGDSEEIEAFRENLSDRHDVDVIYDKCDLTDLAQISAMIANALERFGRIDILVNNAGIQHVSPIDEFPTEMFQRIIETNLASPFYTIRGVLPIMKKNGWGRIVNISSVNGYVGSIHKGPYTAAKHGVLGLTKVVALETAETAITCNAVCPGFVKTAIIESQIQTRMNSSPLRILQVLFSTSVRTPPNILQALDCPSMEDGYPFNAILSLLIPPARSNKPPRMPANDRQ